MNTTSANKKFVFGDAGHCIAFGFGAGLLPRAPGTFGSLLAFPLYWAAAFLPLFAQWFCGALLFAAGVWLCGRAGRALNKEDDRGMVLDEIAAFYFVLLAVPDAWQWQGAAFAAFRFFDAAKPPPVNWLDKNIKGGWGVMLDDAAAAALTCALIYGLIFAARM
ncbi:MAG: phosphatidylglycerophosphatase A family protein [Gammaproteobacteria bacterium]